MRFVFCILIGLFMFLPLPFGSARPVFVWAAVTVIGFIGIIVSLSLFRRAAGGGDAGFIWASEINFLLIPACLFLAVVSWLQFYGFAAVKVGLQHGAAAFEGRSFLVTFFTVSPEATVGTFTVMLSHVVLFLVAAYLIATESSPRTFLHWMVFITSLYILYAFVNYLSGNHYVLWFPKVGDISPLSGPFINKNNFATFLNISVILAALQIFRRRHKKSLPELAYSAEAFKPQSQSVNSALFLVFFIGITCLLLTQSRAGLLSLVGAAIVALFSLRGMSLQLRRAGLFFFGIVGLAVVLVGYQMFDRFMVISQSLDRWILYKQIVDIVADMPSNGYGLGTFREAYAMYRAETSSLIYFARAHNEYAELLMALGFVGFLVLVSTLALAFKRGLQGVEDKVEKAAMLAVIFAVLAHALVDFPLQIPAVSYLFVGVLAMFVAGRPHERGQAALQGTI